MAYIVDQLFPPMNDREESVEFSNFNYWRDPVLDIDCDHLLDLNAAPLAATSAAADTTQQQQQLPRVHHIPPTPPIAETYLSIIAENIKA